MIRKKLKSKKAETLLESLVSLLIATLSVILLSTSIMTAAKTNQIVKDADATFTTELACAEMKSTVAAEDQSLTISFTNDGISSQTVDVDLYGQGSFVSYEKSVE